MPNPHQETPASSKPLKEDLKDIDVLCTLKIKIESQNLDHECLKDHWPHPNQEQDPKPKSEISSILQSPNEDLKDMDVLCTFKIKIESQNSDHGYIKNRWPYPYQDQETKANSGTSSTLQGLKWGLKGHGCSFHLQNQVREQKFRSWMYQRQMTISTSTSRCQTPVRNLQHPPKPKIRT